MFIAKEQVKALTGKDVTSELLIMAQGIIEAYVGRDEAEVDDASDLANLGKATAYQAAYMLENPMITFDQVGATQVTNFGSSVTFRGDASPHIAVLAQVACRNLSWCGTRSVKTGSVWGRNEPIGTWETE